MQYLCDNYLIKLVSYGFTKIDFCDIFEKLLEHAIPSVYF